MMNKPPQKRSSFAPVIGLIIALVLGIIAWLIAPSVIHALAVAIPNFAGNELPLTTTRAAFTAIIVVLALIIFGLVAALTTKKDDQSANEAKLEKERDAMRRRQKAQRAQQRKR
jgi:uncharacterized BrkB/YihY/UPF0761 family membrane protein